MKAAGTMCSGEIGSPTPRRDGGCAVTFGQLAAGAALAARSPLASSELASADVPTQSTKLHLQAGVDRRIGEAFLSPEGYSPFTATFASCRNLRWSARLMGTTRAPAVPHCPITRLPLMSFGVCCFCDAARVGPPHSTPVPSGSLLSLIGRQQLEVGGEGHLAG